MLHLFVHIRNNMRSIFKSVFVEIFPVCCCDVCNLRCKNPPALTRKKFYESFSALKNEKSIIELKWCLLVALRIGMKFQRCEILPQAVCSLRIVNHALSQVFVQNYLAHGSRSGASLLSQNAPYLNIHRKLRVPLRHSRLAVLNIISGVSWRAWRRPAFSCSVHAMHGEKEILKRISNQASFVNISSRSKFCSLKCWCNRSFACH